MKIFQKFFLAMAMGIFLFLPKVTQAIDVTSQLTATAEQKGAGYAPAQDPRLIVANIIKISLSLLGILFLGYTIYAGFMILTSRGEEEKINEGKKTLTRGIIGLIIIMSAFSITLLAQKLATGDAAHQGDYIRIKNTDVDFSDPDPRHTTDRLTCQFGFKMMPDGSCEKE